MDQLIAQTKDDLNTPFTFFIEKAEAENEGQDLIISGVASSTNVDHDQERMSLPALQQMANKINAEGVPLRIEHQKADEAIVGNVFDAHIDERNRLMIKAKVRRENPAGVMLHNALKSGAKLGFSVGGRVKRAYRELAEGAGKLVKTFYDIILDEVSVTPRPANYDSWANQSYGLVAKSLLGPELYNEFLKGNPKLDYLAVIEKSIPETAWEKVEIKNDINNNMGKELKKDSTKEEEMKAESKTEETEEKAESTMETEEKAAEDTETKEKKEEVEESSEKYASVTYVDKKFGEVISLLKSIKKDLGPETTQDEALEPGKPHKQDNPDEETENPQKAEGGANGTETAEREQGKVSTALNSKAHDQDNPDQDTKDSEAGKSAKDETKEDEGKAETSESDHEDGNSYGGEYKLSSIDRALKARGNMSALDAFVAYVTKTMEDMKEGLRKNNKRVIGLEKSIADSIKNDDSIQKSIKVWMKEPGIKKSVSLGVPYAVTKEGMRLRLVPDDFTMVEKSTTGKKQSFKQMWGDNFVSKDLG